MVSESEDMHDVPKDKLEAMQSFKQLELKLRKNRSLKFFTIKENEITPEVVKRMERGVEAPGGVLTVAQPSDNERE